jgi:hypothetical protein
LLRYASVSDLCFPSLWAGEGLPVDMACRFGMVKYVRAGERVIYIPTVSFAIQRASLRPRAVQSFAGSSCFTGNQRLYLMSADQACFDLLGGGYENVLRSGIYLSIIAQDQLSSLY